MQFKREDIGLYVATALIGGGLGLLAGAFLTARINRKREEDFNAEEAARDDEEAWLEEDVFNIVSEKPEFPRGGDVTFNPAEEPSDEKSKKETKKIRIVGTNKIVEDDGRIIPGRQVESHRLSKEDRLELSRLTREYTVGDLQMELVEKGTMTVEELEDALVEEELDDQPIEESIEVFGEEPLKYVAGEGEGRTNYSEQYRDAKPDMEDFLEKPLDDAGPRDVEDLLVTIGNRWEILLTPPLGKAEHQKRTIYFDPEDESVYTKTDGGDIAPADLRVIANEEVRDIIMPWLIFETELEAIYLDDIRNKKTRWYEIIRLKEDDVN